MSKPVITLLVIVGLGICGALLYWFMLADTEISKNRDSAAIQEITRTEDSDARDDWLMTFSEPPKPLRNSFEQQADAIYRSLRMQRYDEAETTVMALSDPALKTRDGLPLLTEAIDHLTNNQSSEFADVLQSMEQWVAAKPDSAVARLLRGRSYYQEAWRLRGSRQAGDTTSANWENYRHYMSLALEDISQAHLSQLSLPQIPEYLLAILTSLGDKQNVHRQAFQQAIAQYPDYYPLYRERFRYLLPFWSGSWEELKAFARETSKKGPPYSVFAPAALATYARNAGVDAGTYLNQPEVWKEIAEGYKEAMDAYPQNTRWLIGFAKIATLAGRTRLSEALLERALAINPQEFNALLAVSELYRQTRRWEAAMASIAKAVELQPINYYALTQAGWAHLWGGRYTRAATYYNQASELRPKEVKNWVNLCHLYYLQDYFEAAINACNMAEKVDPDYSASYYFRAMVYDMLGKEGMAEHDRTTMRQLNAQNK